MKRFMLAVLVVGGCKTDVEKWKDKSDAVVKSDSFQVAATAFIEGFDENDREKLASVLADKIYDYDGPDKPYPRDEVLDMLAEVHAKCLRGVKVDSYGHTAGLVGYERAMRRELQQRTDVPSSGIFVPSSYDDGLFQVWLQPGADTAKALVACGERSPYFEVLFAPRETTWKVISINIPRATSIAAPTALGPDAGSAADEQRDPSAL
jgi:hypothetical protein